MTAQMSVPSATMAAPVSVAESMITRGFFSARYASASARISRPSASVFSTSEVLPPRWRSTSPGRMAEPPGMFSADGIAAMTFTFGFSCAMARMAASVAAAPPMSAFIHSILAGVLEGQPARVERDALAGDARWAGRRRRPCRRARSAGGRSRSPRPPRGSRRTRPLQLRLRPDLAPKAVGLGHLLGLRAPGSSAVASMAGVFTRSRAQFAGVGVDLARGAARPSAPGPRPPSTTTA